MRNIALAVFLFAAGLSSSWADSRYVIRGAEVYDSQTKLTWSRCSVGQEWKDAHCTGAINNFSFEAAQKQAGGGWRIPTKEELVTLIDTGRKNFPAVDTAAFPDMDPGHRWYWTSTPNGNTIAWYIDFTDGYTSGFIDEANIFAVRLVKSNP
jgi:hypothetical protein